MNRYTLVTERLYLHLAHPRLAVQVADFNLRNKEDMMDVEPRRPSAYYEKKGIKRYLKLDYADAMRGSDFRYYLTEKGSDKIIGTVCIGQVLFGSVKSCVLSYKIDKDYRGKGYCSEAVDEMIYLAFHTLRLHRIEAQVMPRNKPSLAIMEKFGFENEGLSRKCFEINEKWEDHYRFALLNDTVSAKQNYR